jgi:hypothetical protein
LEKKHSKIQAERLGDSREFPVYRSTDASLDNGVVVDKRRKDAKVSEMEGIVDCESERDDGDIDRI